MKEIRDSVYKLEVNLDDCEKQLLHFETCAANDPRAAIDVSEAVSGLLDAAKKDANPVLCALIRKDEKVKNIYDNHMIQYLNTLDDLNRRYLAASEILFLKLHF